MRIRTEPPETARDSWCSNQIVTKVALTPRTGLWHDAPTAVPQRATRVPRAGSPRRIERPHNEDLMATEPAARTKPTLRRDAQNALYQRALESLPGGTDSNFRAWGESTIYVDRGKGGMVWDADGNEFVDLRMGYGPVILGHGDERVDDYVNERMRRGVSFSLTSEDEVRAMELVKELTGWVDMARMTVSGTEATMHTMRIAAPTRAARSIVKFEGQYHGVDDYALHQRRPGRRPASSATPTRRSRSPGPRSPGRRRRHDHPGAL